MADKKKSDTDSKEKSDTKVPPKDEEQDLVSLLVTNSITYVLIIF